MLELYHANHSTCSQKVRLCMAEKGLKYKSHLIDLGAKEQLDPEYLKINPNGVVPSLVHDGLIVIDSSVEHGDDDRSTVVDEADMGDQSFVEDLVNRRGVVAPTVVAPHFEMRWNGRLGWLGHGRSIRLRGIGGVYGGATTRPPGLLPCENTARHVMVAPVARR